MSNRELECVEPEVGELLADFVEELLPLVDARIVADHLAACARCEEDARDLRDLRRAIGELPPGLGELAASPIAAPGRRSLLVATTVASVLIAVLALGGWWQAERKTGVDGRVHELERRLARLEAAQASMHATAGAAASADGTRPVGAQAFPAVGIDFAVPLSF
jgi:hypothetical protein